MPAQDCTYQKEFGMPAQDCTYQKEFGMPAQDSVHTKKQKNILYILTQTCIMF